MDNTTMQSHALNFEQAKILVIGDVMLDQYWFGGTARISPEAPVPVVQVERMDERPGGAANVALGLKALGARPSLLGILGEDDAGTRLKQLLKAAAIEFHAGQHKLYSTITKLRILSRNQQMIRLDTEKQFPPEALESLKSQYLQALEGKNAVILSDYDKGTLSDPAWLIAKARAKNIPVIVDPKSRDCSLYRGATLIKPNLKEFEAIVGPCRNEETLVSKAFLFLEKYEIDAMVISRSERGLSVITKEKQVTHIPALAREVHDVTGAGDTVVAVLSAGLAIGMELIQAATLGNLAAGIAVGKLGATTVSVQDIQLSLGQTRSFPLGIMDEHTLHFALNMSRATGERIVFTNGCFDILHAGHVMYLEQAKRLGDRLIVAVNTDASVARLKGRHRPINTLENRMTLLAGLKSVDWVVSFDEETPERLIRYFSPDVLVKGGDYTNLHETPGAQHVIHQGGNVQVLGFKEGCSTTQMIEKILTKTPEPELNTAEG